MKKCISCHKKGLVEIPYTKIWFCKKCFLRLINKRISKVIKNYKMIGKKEKIAISFCGNADSVIIYEFFKKMEGKRIGKLFPVLIDFGFFNTNKIKKLCKELRIIKLKPPKDCNECREKRYNEIIKFMKKNKIKKLISPRNLTEEVTLFISSFMKDNFKTNEFGHVVKNKIAIVKPLIEIPSDELISYAKLKGLKYNNFKCLLRNKHYIKTKEFLENLKKSRKMVYFCVLKSIENLKRF